MGRGASAVFGTPELLAEILAHLALRTIVHSQRVSRRFYETIHSSPRLQTLLFYRAVEPIRKIASATPKRNPFFDDVFTPWFGHVQNGASASVLNCDALRRSSWLESESIREAIAYKGASWRRMFICQPTVTKLISNMLHDLAVMGIDTSHDWEKEFPDGVRMGELFDRIMMTKIALLRMGKDLFFVGIRWPTVPTFPRQHNTVESPAGRDYAELVLCGVHTARARSSSDLPDMEKLKRLVNQGSDAVSKADMAMSGLGAKRGFQENEPQEDDAKTTSAGEENAYDSQP
jgi:hypothetical protein